MTDLPMLILGVLASLFKSRAKLEAEILVLRQQINVLRRRAPKQPHLNNTDRFLFVWLYHWFPSVLDAIAIVRPGALARVRVIVSRTVITYSAPSVPLAGTSRFHRTAAYTRCLRCAGAPRRPASGSGLSLLIPSWHAILSDPGESDIDMFQNFDADIAFAE